MILLPDLVAGIVWAAVALLAIRSRGSLPVLAAVMTLTWLAVEVLPAAALWHRAVLIHLLLTAPGWWPRSWTARIVLIVEYVAAVLVVPWTSAIGAVVLSAMPVVAFALETRGARPSAARWLAVVLAALGFAIPPFLSIPPATRDAVTWAYAAGMAAIALCVLADSRLRPATAAPLDRLIELGSTGDVRATPGERTLARELQSAHDALAVRLEDRLVELRASRRRLAEASLSAAVDLSEDLQDRVRLPLDELADAPSPPGASTARLEEARRHLHGARADIDGILVGLGPRSLEAGLRESLRALTIASPVPTQLDVSGDAPLPAPLLHTAYLVCAEALTNIAKHSGAPSAQIVARIGRTLDLTIRDSGTGGAAPGGGTGLVGMRDRVEAIGGTLELDSTPSGTTISVRLPVDPEGTDTAGGPMVLTGHVEPT